MKETLSASGEARMQRLNKRMQKAIAEKDFRNIVGTRCAMLGYSYDDDSGGGSALTSITAAAASLGSAYVLSQQPNNAVTVPTRTVPAYGAAAPMGSSSILLIVGVIALAGIGLIFAMRG